MTDNPLHEINRTLGAVLTKLDVIEKSISESDMDRAALKKSVDSLVKRTTDLERDMSSAKPFLEKAQKWEQRGIGAGMVLTAMGAIFGGTFVAFKENALTWLGLK